MTAVIRVDLFTHEGCGGDRRPVAADAASLDASARVFEARQFPGASGYPEGAAAARASGLLQDGSVEADARPIRILQGRATGRLSEIRVRPGFADGRAIGCLLEGDVARRADAAD